MKKIYLVVGIIVLLVVVGGAYYLKYGTSKPVTPAQQQQTADEKKTPPPIIFGDVIKIEGQKITLKADQDQVEKAATFDAQTTLVKQVKDKAGLLTLQPAVISDFKVGSNIIIYYSDPPVNSVYKAVKLQLVQ